MIYPASISPVPIVRGAIFSKASGIEPSMFVSAVWDASTAWPPDFQPSWLDVTWAHAAGSDRFGVWASFSVPRGATEAG